MKALAAVLLLALAAFAQGGKDAPKKKRPAGPKVGSKAPDFTLERLDRPGETVTLSSFKGKKPVVLIFGSYT